MQSSGENRGSMTLILNALVYGNSWELFVVSWGSPYELVSAVKER